MTNVLPWFALSVRPRREQYVATLLRRKGFTEYLPLLRTKRYGSGGFKRLEVPLFPGYVFCRLDPSNRLPVLQTPWVSNILGFGNAPQPIDETEVMGIRTLIDSGLTAEPWPFLRVGNWVRIENGPLQGVEGVLLNFKKQQRLVVSVSILQRSVAVEIERGWVLPMSSAPGPLKRRGMNSEIGSDKVLRFEARSAS